MQTDLRRWMTLCEGRDAPLYHSAPFRQAESILRDGLVKPTRQTTGRVYNILGGKNGFRSMQAGFDGNVGISMTRNPRFAGRFIDVWRGQGFILAFDQGRIAQRYKILPTADVLHHRGARQDHDYPFEEWVVAPEGLPVAGLLLSICPSRAMSRSIQGGLRVPEVISDHPAYLRPIQSGGEFNGMIEKFRQLMA